MVLVKFGVFDRDIFFVVWVQNDFGKLVISCCQVCVWCFGGVIIEFIFCKWILCRINGMTVVGRVKLSARPQAAMQLL